MKSIIISSLFMFLSFGNINAQMNASYSNISNEFNDNNGQNMQFYHAKPYQFKVTNFIAPITCLGFGILCLTHPEFNELNLSTRAEILEDGPRKIHLDNYTQYAPGAITLGLSSLGIKGKHSVKDQAIILATSQAIVAAIVIPLKHTVGELRPDGSNTQSFPSGHTSTAFSTAHFMFKEYKDDHLLLALSGYSFAAFTGIYRTINNKHWVGDVAAGAGVGILSTELAYALYPTINKILNPHHKHQSLVYPYYNQGTLGIGFVENL